MVHPDFQISGSGGHADPEIRVGGTVSIKIFLALWASVWSKNKGVGPPGLSLGSTTFVPPFWDLTLCDVECNDFFYPT